MNLHFIILFYLLAETHGVSLLQVQTHGTQVRLFRLSSILNLFRRDAASDAILYLESWADSSIFLTTYFETLGPDHRQEVADGLGGVFSDMNTHWDELWSSSSEYSSLSILTDVASVVAKIADNFAEFNVHFAPYICNSTNTEVSIALDKYVYTQHGLVLRYSAPTASSIYSYDSLCARTLATSTSTESSFTSTIPPAMITEYISSINISSIKTSTTNTNTTNTGTINAGTIDASTANTRTINTSTVDTRTIINSTVNTRTINTSAVNTSTINTSTINPTFSTTLISESTTSASSSKDSSRISSLSDETNLVLSSDHITRAGSSEVDSATTSLSSGSRSTSSGENITGTNCSSEEICRATSLSGEETLNAGIGSAFNYSYTSNQGIATSLDREEHSTSISASLDGEETKSPSSKSKEEQRRPSSIASSDECSTASSEPSIGEFLSDYFAASGVSKTESVLGLAADPSHSSGFDSTFFAGSSKMKFRTTDLQSYNSSISGISSLISHDLFKPTSYGTPASETAETLSAYTAAGTGDDFTIGVLNSSGLSSVCASQLSDTSEKEVTAFTESAIDNPVDSKGSRVTSQESLHLEYTQPVWAAESAAMALDGTSQWPTPVKTSIQYFGHPSHTNSLKNLTRIATQISAANSIESLPILSGLQPQYSPLGLTNAGCKKAPSHLAVFLLWLL